MSAAISAFSRTTSGYWGGVDLLHLRQLLRETGEPGGVRLAFEDLRVLLDVERRQSVGDARDRLRMPPAKDDAEGDRPAPPLHPRQLHLDVAPQALDGAGIFSEHSELRVEIEPVHEGHEPRLAQDFLTDHLQPGLDLDGDQRLPKSLRGPGVLDQHRGCRAVHVGKRNREGRGAGEHRAKDHGR